MEKKTVIAIVGMCGSGKTAITEYLQKKYKWPKVYLGSATFDYMQKHKIPVNYKNEKTTREKIRKELGPDAYAKLSFPKIQKELKNTSVLILESLYSWSEYKFFKTKYKENFKVMAAITPALERFKRLSDRHYERPMKNWQEFQERDYSEIENIAKAGPIVMADFPVLNIGSLQKLHKQIDAYIKQLKL
jgi:dephospho-CoA kinase